MVGLIYITVKDFSMLDQYIQAIQSPSDISSRDIVRQAIEFQLPPRIPYSFINPLKSDFCETAVVAALTGSRTREKGGIGSIYYDEWRVGHEVTGRAWDHAVDHPLRDLDRLNDYQWPEIKIWKGSDPESAYLHQAAGAGKYVVAHDPVMMFERARALMGFEELMIAPYTQPQNLRVLLERLADLTIEVIQKWAALECIDGFMTWEDWGLQTGLQMKVETFREFYRPSYERIIQTAHDCGLHYIWHNCGQIVDMIPDMIEMGVDVLQLDQPRMMGHHFLTEKFGGKICFWNTVDIQWSTSPGRSDEEIRKEILEMISFYNRLSGGFMARQYPQPWDIGLSSERGRFIAETFFNNGCA